MENEPLTQDPVKTGFILVKGSCYECKCYENCPRMRGINRCQNRHWVPVDLASQPVTGVNSPAG